MLGTGELILIFLVVILVFGSSKLPALGDALGRGIKNFKRTFNESESIDVTPKPDADAAAKAPDVKVPGVKVPPPAETAAKK